MLEVPVAFLIFNRPDTTQRVFAEIARARPKRLLVVADGPRTEADAEKCRQARAIIEQVDWDCEVLKNYSDVNLGCKRRVSSGLDWVFEQCEEAIILEDDCLPHPTFFRFCAELLEKYAINEQVMIVSGNNFQFGRKRGEYSYYFSCYSHIWGWATWRRSWKHYDLGMMRWPELRETKWLNGIMHDSFSVCYWEKALDKAYAEEIDTWDIQWLFTCWSQDGLTVLPNINLVSNIGFMVDATHTKTDIYKLSSLATTAMEFPMRHPPYICRDRQADEFTFNRIFAHEFNQSSLYRRIARKLFALAHRSFKHPSG